MTEAEWLDCNVPWPLLEFVQGKASDRKLRLFGVACCRRVWPLLEDDRSRRVVEVAEALADRPSENRELLRELRAAADHVAAALHATVPQAGDPRGRAWAEARAYSANAARETASTPIYVGCVAAAVSHAVKRWAQTRGLPPRPTAKRERANQCHLLRDLFGNPFQEIVVEAGWLTWHGGLISAMVRTIYQERVFDQMPILADALEDAGCTDVDILAHCRGPGPHVRGCWVIDLLLGKE
jgi:hypothetical protein